MEKRRKADMAIFVILRYKKYSRDYGIKIKLMQKDEKPAKCIFQQAESLSNTCLLVEIYNRCQPVTTEFNPNTIAKLVFKFRFKLWSSVYL